MQKSLDTHHNTQESKESHSTIEGEIANILHETWKEQQGREHKEKLGNDSKIFQNLAKYYYGTDIVAGTSNLWKDALYVIIQHEWKEKLMLIGTGQYTPEMFSKTHDDAHVWFLYGPLSLFVVKANTHDDSNTPPKKYLNTHTSFYSQKSWQVCFHTKNRDIEYGKYNKIMSYEEAINELQNASVRKAFYKRTSKRNNLNTTFIKNMKILKQKEREWIKNWYENKVKFDFEDQEYMKLRTCLFHLAHKNVDEIYTVIQSFDRHKGLFILPKTM